MRRFLPWPRAVVRAGSNAHPGNIQPRHLARTNPAVRLPALSHRGRAGGAHDRGDGPGGRRGPGGAAAGHVDPIEKKLKPILAVIGGLGIDDWGLGELTTDWWERKKERDGRMIINYNNNRAIPFTCYL